MNAIRSFLALPTAPEARARILTVLQELESVPSEVKWDSPEKLHITLKFLGEVQAATLESLLQLLEPRVAAIPSFDVTYAGIGGFPDVTHPRVLWVGTLPNPELMSLQSMVENTCAQLGFRKEERAFHPHITLGRVKGSRGLDRLTAKVKSLTFEPVTAHCSTLQLLRSDLHPAGSRYTVLKSIPFHS